ncbi:MAG: AraC family transcriptional regulator [Lentisphaeria bacterium]|nr:AraC family transcriptional regulator [Lentisphaeria bacterium]
MDNFVIHAGAMTRRFPSLTQVRNIGYEKEKHWVIRNTFNSFNFSVILSGRGFFEYKGHLYEVRSPCVIYQMPEEKVHYGPYEGEHWEELFFIFSSSDITLFNSMNLFSYEQLIYQFDLTSTLLNHIKKFLKQLVEQPENGDWVDLQVQQLLIEIFSSRRSIKSNLTMDKVLKIKKEIEDYFETQLDLESILQEAKMSLSTFHRYWKQVSDHSPHQYQLSLRIQKAQRLLAETNLRIKTIATEIGFDDPLYFSRCFRKQTGLSPKKYRLRNYPRFMDWKS